MSFKGEDPLPPQRNEEAVALAALSAPPLQWDNSWLGRTDWGLLGQVSGASPTAPPQPGPPIPRQQPDRTLPEARGHWRVEGKSGGRGRWGEEPGLPPSGS